MFILNQAQRFVFYSLLDVLLLCSIITFGSSLYFVLFVKTSINKNFQMILVAQMTFALCGDIWTALNRPVFLPTLFAVTYAPVLLSVQSKLMALFLTVKSTFVTAIFWRRITRSPNKDI
ncbi:unnamed protein product, partial [Mesorhabditis belari]|uniref:Uncharacterized protein n=1 Tax=Mesorhabditis belari TaxID=2138241 RepID=A0AAF3F5C3_9BILA